MKKLYKARTDIMIDGVCRGIATYANVDVTIVRLAFVIFGLMGFSSILVYIVCSFIFPREPEDTIYHGYEN